jgi:deoxycytidylate deaminase
MAKAKAQKPPRLTVTSLTSANTSQGATQKDYELVFGLVAAVGTDLKFIEDALCDRLKDFNYYDPVRIHLSDFLKNFEIPKNGQPVKLVDKPEDKRITSRMDAGNILRERTGHGDVLALLATQKIQQQRKSPPGRKAYVINSLKHPSELNCLRRIYGPGFFLIAVHSPESQRETRLATAIAQSNDTAEVDQFRLAARELMRRDEFEPGKFGQQVRETFHLADVFVSLSAESNSAKNSAKNSIKRFMELLFGNPFQTPTPDEYLMFHAHAAALRSGSLARQVGAVVGTERAEVISAGCNDVPRAEGGLYLAGDADDERDMRRARDSSDEQKEKMVAEVITTFSEAKWIGKNKKLKASEVIASLKGTRLMSVIEFGRDAHAEMEAILAAGRIGVSIVGQNIYSTTFPCHNCAKLIIAAGIRRVVYIEPYPKSLAIELHSDSIFLGKNPPKKKNSATPVKFEPFVGVGPRKYMDFFSLSTSNGGQISRKDDAGCPIEWNSKIATPRSPMLPLSYLERETDASAIVSSFGES